MRFDLLRSAPLRFASLRSGTIDGSFALHAFQTSTPCWRSLRCCGLATSFVPDSDHPNGSPRERLLPQPACRQGRRFPIAVSAPAPSKSWAIWLNASDGSRESLSDSVSNARATAFGDLLFVVCHGLNSFRKRLSQPSLSFILGACALVHPGNGVVGAMNTTAYHSGSVHGRGGVISGGIGSGERADPGVELGWSPRQAVPGGVDRLHITGGPR